MQLFSENFTEITPPSAVLLRRPKCMGRDSYAHSNNKKRIRKWNFITIGGKSVFNKQWYDAGVETLSDILDKEGSFLSFSEFKKKYNIKTNFLHYLGLCNAIPKQWRQVFERDFEKKSACTRESTHPRNISLMTRQQVRAFYVAKAFQKPTAEAYLIKAGFTDQTINFFYFFLFFLFTTNTLHYI